MGRPSSSSDLESARSQGAPVKALNASILQLTVLMAAISFFQEKAEAQVTTCGRAEGGTSYTVSNACTPSLTFCVSGRCVNACGAEIMSFSSERLPPLASASWVLLGAVRALTISAPIMPRRESFSPMPMTSKGVGAAATGLITKPLDPAHARSMCSSPTVEPVPIESAPHSAEALRMRAGQDPHLDRQ